jgi:hypothetical protein
MTSFICVSELCSVLKTATSVPAGNSSTHAINHAEFGSFGAGAAVAVPVAIYTVGICALHDLFRAVLMLKLVLSPMAVILILLTPLTGNPVLLTGLILVALLSMKIDLQFMSLSRMSPVP